jgi:hypothetical protein
MEEVEDLYGQKDKVIKRCRKIGKNRKKKERKETMNEEEECLLKTGIMDEKGWWERNRMERRGCSGWESRQGQVRQFKPPPR